MKVVVIGLLLVLASSHVRSQPISEVNPSVFYKHALTDTGYGGCYIAFRYRDSLGSVWNAVIENHFLFNSLKTKLKIGVNDYTSYMVYHLAYDIPLEFDSVGNLPARLFRNRRRYQKLVEKDQDHILSAVYLLESNPSKSRYTEVEIISAAFFRGLALHNKRTQLRVRFKTEPITE